MSDYDKLVAMIESQFGRLTAKGPATMTLGRVRAGEYIELTMRLAGSKEESSTLDKLRFILFAMSLIDDGPPEIESLLEVARLKLCKVIAIATDATEATQHTRN